MKSTASGRSALILASGLLVCLVGPSHAGTDVSAGDPASEGSSRVVSHHAHHKSGKPALKSLNGNQDARTVVNSGAGAPVIPPFVADANAQLSPAEVPTNAAEGMRARADDLVQNSPNSVDDPPSAEQQVVPPDQLNDMDRTVREEARDTPAAPGVAIASAEAAADAEAAPEVRPATRDHESSLWDHTSLIGKIFIGFGALLTVASAGRMFMA